MPFEARSRCRAIGQDERMHRRPLPPRLGSEFAVRKAAAAGVGRSRRDAADLHRPFYGVRSKKVPATFLATASCCLPRMKPGQCFGGRTAMRLWGIPLPFEWNSKELLDVVVPTTAAAPRTAGVIGRRLARERLDIWTIHGLPVADPVAALFSCASELTLDQAIVAIDALITTASGYPGLGPGRPMATLNGIRRRLAEWGRFPGCATIRSALPFARERVESPKETETRLLIVEAGLPEPVVQFEVHAAGSFVARVDLAYPELKIALVLDGDSSRTAAGS